MTVITVLGTTEWQARSARHLARVQQYTQARRERRSRGAVHPVYDFLFQYYSYSAGKLEAWHPAPHEGMEDSPAARALFHAPLYEAHAGVLRRVPNALSLAERETLQQVRQVLCDTRERAANFGCYGLHEWAMVYGGHDVRHAGIAPLRLPQEQIDALVSQRPVACSHFDAFRFFAPAAKPLNRLPLAWATRYDAEQPGCIHANMDLYRWAYTAMPHIGSDLLADCFELAVQLRELDMRASPYDLRALDFEPVCIETPEGREEYQRLQRALSARAAVLRDALIDSVSSLLRQSTAL